MIERLRAIAVRFGIGEEALREVVDLFESSLPRTPTVRVAGEDGEPSATPPAQRLSDAPRYEVVRRIARGGFSEVREVKDLHVGRSVAQKVQLPSRASPEDCARFRQEVEITARLQHPGVVPVHDWGELGDGRLWFTMKKVQGETIKARIVELHRLSGAEMVRALRRLIDDFRRLCEPVAFAHEQGIIHRDISPQNLMVGGLGEVHVMDWGLARDLGRKSSAVQEMAPAVESTDPSETDVRTRVAGTPFYMPPEQARGEIKAMGPASDVYALGAVLYEILCGHPPYRIPGEPQELPKEIVRRVLEGPPRAIEEVARREVPAGLLALCKKAMARDPADRYENARALMEALRDFQDGADRAERARAIVEEAHRAHREEIARKREEAARLNARSREHLAGLRPFDRAQDKAEGWKLADQAAELEQEALREEIRWTQKLRSALNEAPDLEEAHAALAELYAERLLRAEEENKEAEATSFAALVEEHAGRLESSRRGRYESLLRGEGRLSLVTEPAGAQVLVIRYERQDRYLTANESMARVEAAPVVGLALPRGSYLLLLRAPGYMEARYPVRIGRDEHWDGIRPGGKGLSPIRLLREQELGPEEVYVPAGWFTAGGDDRAGEAMPRTRVWVDSFVIQKHPVTNAEYVVFLNELVEEGRREEALRHCPTQRPGGTMGGDAPLAYMLDERSGRFALRAPEVEGALPVVLVDFYAAMAYAAHRAQRTGLPWRLPSELEWEKAARGVDGRCLPWGDQVEPTWACVSGSHADRKEIRPVEEYPTDVSPYGVRGMTGNVRDWCAERWTVDGPPLKEGVLQIEAAAAGDAGLRAIRGGAWISAGDLIRLCVRYAEPPGRRHGVLGFRLARSTGDPQAL